MSFFSDVERDLVVATRTPLADGVVAVDLVAPNGRDLPAWTPGSHIDVRVAPDTERQYSLCGDPTDRSRWRVAVLREDAGRGGSVAAHEQIAVGDRVRVRGPRNHFGFDPQTTPAPVFVAGGIGITPIRVMVEAAARAGLDWRLHYAGRSRRAMAFADELLALDPDRVTLYAADEGARLDLPAVVAGLPDDAQVYACGPLRLTEELDALTQGSPDGRLHSEHFVAREFGAPVWTEPFEVELALRGETVTVPPERSILDVLDDAGVLVPSSCRRGTCGSCETPVLGGEVEHRDSVLTPAEQADSLTMMVCVSRAAGPTLVLDL
ncbi:MAG: PDR/VanB family oxidoreductase [Lapillicoccus sp.]